MKLHCSLSRAAWPVLAMLVGCAATDARLVQAQVPASGSSCPKQHSGRLAKIDPAHVGACIQLRDEVGYGVLEITKDMDFASGCPTPITKVLTDEDDTACALVEGALKRNDLLRIDDWGDGELTVTLRRGQEWVLDRKPLRPIKAALDGKDRLLAYGTSANIDGVDVEYRFYLGYLASKADGYSPRRLEKYYRVEVFGPTVDGSTTTCASEMPDIASNTTLVDCDGLEANRPEDDGQLPSGGGGEPPKPKP